MSNIPPHILAFLNDKKTTYKNKIHRKGITRALWRAAKQGKSLQSIKCLLCLDANPLRLYRGVSILHALVSRTDGSVWISEHPEHPEIEEAIKLLVSVGGRALMEGNDSEHEATPLGWAAWYGRPRAVKVLLELGANTESKSAYDTTPLESAMSQENDEIINILASYTPEPPSKKIRLIRKTPEDLRRENADWLEEGAREHASLCIPVVSECFRKLVGKTCPGPARKAIAQFIMNLPEDWTAYTAPDV